jgi:hypothetical protein
VPTLHQPVEPARLRATIGGREVLEEAEVVALTDRTLVVDVRDAMLALALSVARRVQVTLDFGGGSTTLLAEPGRRASDNPTSRRVELVLRERR